MNYNQIIVWYIVHLICIILLLGKFGKKKKNVWLILLQAIFSPIIWYYGIYTLYNSVEIKDFEKRIKDFKEGDAEENLRFVRILLGILTLTPSILSLIINYLRD